MYGLNEIKRMNAERTDAAPVRTPRDIADEVLRKHAIQDHFRRNGEQIRDLLVEAVNIATRG